MLVFEGELFLLGVLRARAVAVGSPVQMDVFDADKFE